MTIGAGERAALEQAGIYLHNAKVILGQNDPWANNFALAMDAQPTLVSIPNSGIPTYLTTIVDPEIIRILTSPNKAASIIGEKRKGSWTDQTAMFPVSEVTGEVSSYGDYNTNGRAGLNVAFPQRQSYLFQNIVNYGDLEAERMGLAKIQWAADLNKAAASILDKFMNLTYFYGVSGLQNYGILNDPALQAPIAPAVKAYGGTKWIVGSVQQATANEVFADIQSLYTQLVAQGGGLIDDETPMVLAMSPKSKTALKATNQFGINVAALLAENFPGLRIETAVQYGALTASNPQGNPAGEFVQLIALNVQGQDSGFTAFNEKLRSFPLFRDLSSFRQKFTSGTWGSIIRLPYAYAGLLGV